MMKGLEAKQFTYSCFVIAYGHLVIVNESVILILICHFLMSADWKPNVSVSGSGSVIEMRMMNQTETEIEIVIERVNAVNWIGGGVAMVYVSEIVISMRANVSVSVNDYVSVIANVRVSDVIDELDYDCDVGRMTRPAECHVAMNWVGQKNESHYNALDELVD